MYFDNFRSMKTNCSFMVHFKFRVKSDGTKVLYVHKLVSSHNHFDLHNVTDVNHNDGAPKNDSNTTGNNVFYFKFKTKIREN